MERFAPALRRLAGELDLPRSERAAVLAELAADLEAVYAHHRRQGAAEEDAARKAEDLVLGTPDVIRRLSQIHHAPWRGWSESVGARLSGGVDLVLLLGGVVPMGVAAGAAVVVTLARFSGPAAWLLAGLGVLIAGLIVRESVRLALGAPARSASLSLLLGLSVLAPAAGLLALVVGAYQAALVLSARAAARAAADPAAFLAVVDPLAVAGSTFLLGLLLGITGSLSWFILLSHSSARVIREVEAMLSGPAGDGAVQPQHSLSLVSGGAE